MSKSHVSGEDARHDFKLLWAKLTWIQKIELLTDAARDNYEGYSKNDLALYALTEYTGFAYHENAATAWNSGPTLRVMSEDQLLKEAFSVYDLCEENIEVDHINDIKTSLKEVLSNGAFTKIMVFAEEKIK